MYDTKFRYKQDAVKILKKQYYLPYSYMLCILKHQAMENEVSMFDRVWIDFRENCILQQKDVG